MQFSYCFGGDPVLKTLKVGTATVTAGTLCIAEATHLGEVTPCTTTSVVDCMGLALNTGVYAAALEATVTSIVNPMAVFRGKFSGAAAEDTALTVCTNTGASTTVFSSVAVSAADQHAGTLFILTGANAGLTRCINSWIAATSVTTTVVFPANIAVGDTGVVIAFKHGTRGATLTTALTQIRADIANATGATVITTGLELEKPINTASPVMYMDFIVADHCYNPID